MVAVDHAPTRPDQQSEVQLAPHDATNLSQRVFDDMKSVSGKWTSVTPGEETGKLQKLAGNPNGVITDGGAPTVAAVPPEGLSDANFAAVAKSVLGKLGVSGDMPISQLKIEQALQNPSFQGQEAAALAALDTNYAQLAALCGSSTLTPDALNKFNDNWQEYALAALAQGTNGQTMLNMFGDNGKSITLAELQGALNDPKLTNVRRQVATALAANFSKVSTDGNVVTMADISKYAASLSKDPNLEAGIRAVVNVSGFIGTTQQAEAVGPLSLYGDGGQPTPAAVVQGAVGDCSFDADLAAVASSNPQLIKNAIVPNADGTYTVTFPGAPNEHITVPAPTDAELGVFNEGTKNGVWPAVMEEAYGQYLQNHSLIDKAEARIFGSTPPELALSAGNFPGPPMDLLTGTTSKTMTLGAAGEAAISADLQYAFGGNTPRAVSAYILNPSAPATTSSGFINDHSYSVMGFDPHGPNGGTVSVRNPWGPNSPPVDGQPTGPSDGTVKISLDEFMKNFTGLTMSG
jgi:hypothetical protein